MTVDVTGLRELLAKATPTPWVVLEAENERPIRTRTQLLIAETRHHEIRAVSQRWGDEPSDAALVVAAVNSLPALLDAVKALERIEAYCGDNWRLEQVKEFATHALAALDAEKGQR